MQLIEIDKVRYRKNLNIIIVGFISSLLVLSLLFGTVFISAFSNVSDITPSVQAELLPSEREQNELSQPEVGVTEKASEGVNVQVEVEQDSNFRYNLLGVILALLANAAILHSAKNSAFFTEVYYVWKVKQLQNLVYRKLKKIKLAAKSGEETALIILSFYYQSQLQVYQLDDNTITLETIQKHLQELNDTINEFGLTISSDQFDKSLIATY